MPVLLPLFLAIPPIVALGVAGTWIARPALRRDSILRAALIVSVSLAAIEALVGRFLVGTLWMMSRSNLEF
jgi:hypothetical protein